jgi:hypothetical protein
MKISVICLSLLSVLSCVSNSSDNNTVPVDSIAIVDNGQSDTVELSGVRFGSDLDFLRNHHKDLVLLSDEQNKAQLIILPAYQGRVMTSTADGSTGMSFGWLNHALIASGKISPHMHAVGGEERIWLGPEGGQFSIYFKKGTDFAFDHWFVPKELDTESFRLVSSSRTMAHFEKNMHLENYSGTGFELKIDRIIRLLDSSSISRAIGVPIPSPIKSVGFESDNRITNKGTNTWSKKTGLLSIWILSMMNASPQSTIAIPYRQGDSAKLGKIVTDDYFGKVPAERLKVENGLILLKADASYRSKIGISPSRALPMAASYDALNGVLTIAQFSLPVNEKDYVNSLWQMQEHPFSGDAVNAYNDGPVQGNQMGRFYELESSSPAAALAPGKSIQHIHRTMHFTGNKESLDMIARKILGVGVDKISLV